MIKVWTERRLAGFLDRYESRGSTFLYEPGAELQRAISLTMPVRTASWNISLGLAPIFEMNLPEVRYGKAVHWRPSEIFKESLNALPMRFLKRQRKSVCTKKAIPCFETLANRCLENGRLEAKVWLIEFVSLLARYKLPP